ncbi:RNA dependent RNA polymerase-domain-containing protein [Hygrophoropsis aurantiaca]|uniref:RNA dependent RNA polymerase-domain-containing protein n=1 Tax=Hygrophoropsis aurantiaca TaxID=72124 RepID=A0ACB8A5U0_9AGAM|nr:RNA dependent RNA polymerase-domain-containing protein [Hygrophoropsis aurantiaca]
MQFDIRNVDFETNEWAVTKALATILHACPGPFASDSDERRVNFKVTLNPGHSGVRNDGSGLLTLPPTIGPKFMRWLKSPRYTPIHVGGKILKFYRNSNPIPKGLVMELEKAPYIDPDIDQERQRRRRMVDADFRIANLQIGTFYRPVGSRPNDPRAFSVEWDADLVTSSLGWLRFEYDHKLLRAKIGDFMRGETQYHVVIKLSSINKLAIGYDFGNQFLCFDLLTPPIVEEELIGGSDRVLRRRVSALHPGHARVAPYAHHLRILLSEDGDLEKFERICAVVELRRPYKGVTIEATQQGFFSAKSLAEMQRWFTTLEKAGHWEIAFQAEAVLHNGLLNTKELRALIPSVEKLIAKHPEAAREVMRFFSEAAVHRPPSQTFQQCFDIVLHTKCRPRRQPPSGRFFSHRATFTPTRMLLEGPYIIQSNRIIREYEGYEEHFIRVDFRDEDGLQFRWDRDVDGTTYLQTRVGGILRNGFDIGGRHFQFLAYSSSALREHAVWFMNPFWHPVRGHVTPDNIRNMGDFADTIYSPSKYAARLAQAFTATDTSIIVQRDQWREIPDIQEGGIVFTDGVGTISKELANMIWWALCDGRSDNGKNTVTPSAYQIRFLGYKGMVAVDEQLTGIQMRLRPSMRKYRAKNDWGEIEIARAFDRPNLPHLNRPLVMVLEDRGAKLDAFMTLQDMAVADARMAHDSIERFTNVLDANKLGHNFSLSTTLKRLATLGLDLKPTRLQKPIDNPFLARLRACAINHVLRGIKHSARIPIPNSYMLVGVADEGNAYIKAGYTDVYTLAPGKIFACVQNPEDKEPTWISGPCVVSRSPVVHPGDVQRVYAIGQPPKDKMCLFAHLRNVVVFSSTGPQSLPSGLGGGDLDGDLYEIIQYPGLLVTEQVDPASYPPISPFSLKRPSEIEDVCDFIVEYISSDVVGLIADKHITIADQSKDGTSDGYCIKLAEMHSRAVDYVKHGVKVDIRDLPRNLIRYKPDWKAAEAEDFRRTDYYESARALGHLYRNITLEDIPDSFPRKVTKHFDDPISKVLKPLVDRQLQKYVGSDGGSLRVEVLFMAYRDELAYLSTTHTLSKLSGVRLREEEVVIGTILATCSQKRWRTDKIYSMKECASFLVNDTRRAFIEKMDSATGNDLREGLRRAWAAWDHSLMRSSSVDGDCFGAESFGLVALGSVLECLDRLGELPQSHPRED